MSHYIHESIPHAKFEDDSSSSLGDMTSQDFPQKKGTSHQIRIFTPQNGFNFKRMGFYVQNRSSRPKNNPPSQFQQFSSRGKLLIFKIFGMSR